MAYGAECFDSQGRTIFNSNDPCELVCYETSGNSFLQTGPASHAGSRLQVYLPDYLFGIDQSYLTGVSMGNFQIRTSIPANAPIPSGGKVVRITHYPAGLKLASPQNNQSIMSTNAVGTYPANMKTQYATVTSQTDQAEFVTTVGTGSVSAAAAAAALPYFKNAKFMWQYYNGVLEKQAYIYNMTVENVRRFSNGTLDYSYAYIIWRTRGGQNLGYGTFSSESSRGNSYQNLKTGNRYGQTFQPRYYIHIMDEIVPEIWVRPRSGTHSFSIMYETARFPGPTGQDPRVGVGAAWTRSLHNHVINIFSNSRTATTWDIKVTVPADSWGKMLTSRSLKYADSSNKAMGLECYDAGNTSWNSFEGNVQKTTYSSLAKVAKMAGSNSYGDTGLLRNSAASGGSPYQGTSIQQHWQASHSSSPGTAYEAGRNPAEFIHHDGTVAQHPLKYYARMNATAMAVSGTGTHNKGSPWTWQYKWYGNNHIKSEWRWVNYTNTTSGSPLYYPFFVSDIFYESKGLFGLATFGEPA
tara:strand:- start:126 stop:1697 length:1572 start_codon:yes stop_codon:yes gene_type:complete